MDEQFLQHVYAPGSQVLCRGGEARSHMAFKLHDSVRQEADRHGRNTGHTSSIEALPRAVEWKAPSGASCKCWAGALSLRP